MNVSLTSQLNEAKKYDQIISGDSNVVNHIPLEQCDELILTLNRSEEKLLQRRVSYDMILVIDLCFISDITLLSFTIFIM